MQPPFFRIITHTQPHLDEIVAIRLLKRYGDSLYPGVKNAPVIFTSSGEDFENKGWEEHMKEGTLFIGTGGGPFDEHPTFTEERKQGQSACLLVAKALKLDTHPIYKRLIELVTEADQKGVHEFHIANRLKTRYRLNPKNPEKAINMINEILDDWEKEQQLFVDSRAKLQIMGNKNEYKLVPLPDGDNLKIAVIESDSYKMSAAARSLRVPLLIQKMSSGHILISSDTDRYTFDLRKVISKIRKAECIYRGMDELMIAKTTPEEWEKEGKILEAPNWFYQIPGQNLLNGSETKPDTEPTKIPLSLIIEIVEKNIITVKKEIKS